MDRIHVVIVDRNAAPIYQTEHMPAEITAHSTAKPVQALPIYLLHLDEKYRLSSQELAILSSSHLGQSQHIEVLQTLLRKTGITEDELILTPVAPTGRIAFQNWRSAGQAKSKLFHPCVGNHIAMILAQRALTGSSLGYEKERSTVQQLIKDLFAKLCQCPAESIRCVRDSCGVPSFCVSPINIAIVYKNLVTPPTEISSKLSVAIQKNNAAMRAEPLMLEGDGCLSTIITSNHGLLAKTGTHGLLAIADEYSECGLVIKSDSGNWTNVARVAERILYQLGYKNESLSVALQSI